MNREIRKQKFLQTDLYPVTCERHSAGRSNLEVLNAAIRGGAGIIQLREKECTAGELFRMALRFRKVTADAEMLLIINDHVDIALAVEADGVQDRVHPGHLDDLRNPGDDVFPGADRPVRKPVADSIRPVFKRSPSNPLVSFKRWGKNHLRHNNVV